MWLGVLGPDMPALGEREKMEVTQSQVAAMIDRPEEKKEEALRPGASATKAAMRPLAQISPGSLADDPGHGSPGGHPQVPEAASRSKKGDR
jgi:hypothetical protein